MVVELDQSLSRQKPDQQSIEVLRRLTSADRTGSHVLYAEHSVVDKLLTFEWPIDIRSGLQRVRATLVDRNALRHQVCVYCNVVANGPIRRIISKSTVKFNVPMACFTSTGSMHERSRLLAEAYQDCALYQWIAQWYVQVMRWNVRLTLESHAGGGDQTDHRYLEWRDSARECPFFLAVTDSDKRRPDGAVGETASKLRRAAEPNDHTGWLLLIDDCRHAEALIPRECLLQHCTYSAEDRERAESLYHASTYHPHGRYIDYKRGLAGYDLRRSTEDHDFWWPHLAELGVNNEAIAQFEDCSGNDRPCEKHSDCQCQLLRGHRGVLQEFIRILEEDIADLRDIPVNGRLKGTWELVGAHIASFGVALQPYFL